MSNSIIAPQATSKQHQTQPSTRRLTGNNQCDTSKMTLTDFSIDSIIGANKNQRLTPDVEPTKVKETIPLTQDSDGLTQDEFMCRKLGNDNRKLAFSSPHQPSTVKKYRPKNYQCPECPMAFSNNGQLKNHVRIHTGERPFICIEPDCNKSFTRNEELTRHKLIHTGVRPHNCTVCGKRFGRKDHLKKHVRTHERKKQRKRIFVNNSPVNESTSRVSDASRRVAMNSASPMDDITLMQKFKAEMSAASINPNPSQTLVVPPISHMNQIDYARAVAMLTPITTTSQHQIPNIPPMPIVTSPSHVASMLQGQPQPSCNLSIGITTQETIQRLAKDYWFNLLGYYQQQRPVQNPALGPADDINSLFRRT